MAASIAPSRGKTRTGPDDVYELARRLAKLPEAVKADILAMTQAAGREKEGESR